MSSKRPVSASSSTAATAGAGGAAAGGGTGPLTRYQKRRSLALGESAVAPAKHKAKPVLIMASKLTTAVAGRSTPTATEIQAYCDELVAKFKGYDVHLVEAIDEKGKPTSPAATCDICGHAPGAAHTVLKHLTISASLTAMLVGPIITAAAAAAAAADTPTTPISQPLTVCNGCVQLISEKIVRMRAHTHWSRDPETGWEHMASAYRVSNPTVSDQERAYLFHDIETHYGRNGISAEDSSWNRSTEARRHNVHAISEIRDMYAREILSDRKVIVDPVSGASKSISAELARWGVWQCCAICDAAIPRSESDQLELDEPVSESRVYMCDRCDESIASSIADLKLQIEQQKTTTAISRRLTILLGAMNHTSRQTPALRAMTKELVSSVMALL